MQFLIGAFLGVVVLAGGLFTSSQRWTVLVDDVASQQDIQLPLKTKNTVTISPKKETKALVPGSTQTKDSVVEQAQTEEKQVDEMVKVIDEPAAPPHEPVPSCEGQHEGVACVAFSQGGVAEGICRPDATGTLSCITK